jgi:acetyl-CoA acetyltransferase
MASPEVFRTPPPSMYRTTEGLGVWPHRGKVAAVGIGHAPTARRWDERPETSVGGLSLIALRKAMDDAGVTGDQVDGLVVVPDTTTGAYWPAGKQVSAEQIAAFQQTDDPLDGVAKLSPEWIMKNMPELTNLKTVINAGTCMSHALQVAIEAVGTGMTHTCLVLKGWHNYVGRYYQGGANSEPTVSGPGKFSSPWGGPACYGTAQQFQRYMYKYNKNHDMVAPFVVNSRRNGLLNPDGYWAQHRPEPLTAEDYINARWVAKPANLFDNDIPIMAAGAYLITTSERAQDMKQKPVYVLGHASNRFRARSLALTLEEVEESTDLTGRLLYESAGISPSDLDFENMYDGFGLFHIFHIEGLRYAGIKRGEALDLFQGDITIEGPNPVSPSGGNIGSGRTRFWLHSDSIQQLQGRAGARQIKKPVEVGVSGGPTPTGGNFMIWSSSPD